MRGCGKIEVGMGVWKSVGLICKIMYISLTRLSPQIITNSWRGIFPYYLCLSLSMLLDEKLWGVDIFSSCALYSKTSVIRARGRWMGKPVPSSSTEFISMSSQSGPDTSAAS